MLGDVKYDIIDVDPFFRTPDEITKATKFQEDCGDKFSKRIAKAVNVLAQNRSCDMIAPFVEAFCPKSQPSEPTVLADFLTLDPLSSPSLTTLVQNIAVKSGSDYFGNLTLQVVIALNGEKTAFQFGSFFHQELDGAPNSDAPVDDDLAYRQRILSNAQMIVQQWYAQFVVENRLFCLKDYLNLDKTLSTKVEISTPTDATDAKKKHLAKTGKTKLPMSLEKNVVQRIKYDALDDGYVGLCLVSFSVVTLVAKKLDIPLHQFFRYISRLTEPEVQYSDVIPVPLLSLFLAPKYPTGKLKILREIIVCPKGKSWEPATLFKRTSNVVQNFRKAMYLNQPWKMLGTGSVFWGVDKVVDAFVPLRKLMADEELDASFVVNLNTLKLAPKELYEIKSGKPKKVETLLKMLSAFFRRYRSMVAVLNPINEEHHEKLRPFCERWAARQRQILLFHENFAVFNETLASLPKCFRGALISVKGDDTVQSVITRATQARRLGLPMCLQNSTGVAFSDSTILLEMAVGLGIHYVKLDAPGRPEILRAANSYEDLAELYSNYKKPYLTIEAPKTTLQSPKILSQHPLNFVQPSVFTTQLQEK